VSDLVALGELVEQAGGVKVLSSYLQLDADVVALALGTPPTAATERVARMVEENTRKLMLMPSQGGFFWRLTRKRVVKDWLILARQGLHALPPVERDPSGEGLTEEQKTRLDLLGKIGL
jgi:hypothetical protein